MKETTIPPTKITAVNSRANKIILYQAFFGSGSLNTHTVVAVSAIADTTQ